MIFFFEKGKGDGIGTVIPSPVVFFSGDVRHHFRVYELRHSLEESATFIPNK